LKRSGNWHNYFMYVRVAKSPNSPYPTVHVMKNQRINGKPRAKIIRYLGVAHNDGELEQLQRLGRQTIEALKGEVEPGLFGVEDTYERFVQARSVAEKHPVDDRSVNFAKMVHLKDLCLGFHDIYGRLYHELGFHRILPQSRNRNASHALFHTVMARLANPDSKRRNDIDLAKNFGIRLQLEKVYRMMDHLDEARVERIQQRAMAAAATLLDDELDVILFDCTALYFNSFTEEALDPFEYSKEAEFNGTLVFLALMVTPEGLPVGYELFPGKVAEIKSLIPVLNRLESRLKIRHKIYVADRDMVSQAELEAIEAAGWYYVVGTRIRRHASAKEILAWAASPKEHRPQVFETTVEPNRRLHVRWSAKRAKQDQSKRNRLLKKLKRKYPSGTPIPSHLLDEPSTYQHFLKKLDKTSYLIDDEHIAKDAQWDGLHGVITHLPDTTKAHDAMDYYAELRQVESCFEVTQHDLKIRPILHWTPTRIRAHVAIAFMTLTCERHLCYRTKIQGTEMSAETIRLALESAIGMVFQDEQTLKHYAHERSMDDDCKRLYRYFGVKQYSYPYPFDLH